MKKLLIILIISLISQLSQANERFIPLELFTGGEIRDDTEIKFTKANLVFGEKKRKKIVGPEDWKNPQTGKIVKVYKRTRKGQSGVKRNYLLLLMMDNVLEEFGIVGVEEE